MTWTLRLFDSDGVEIGWVKTGPYEYDITHPDGEDHSRVSVRIEILENPEVRGGYKETLGGVQEAMTETLETVDVSGKEHLEYIETELSKLNEVGSTSLVDE